jgi:protocatechuate 3,4-dioxygenase beta subunit
MSRELQAILDAEIMRLPEKYRSPFVLCCLETRSKTEAASELGWKEGTVSSRLARAKSLLSRRLSERGVELGVVLSTLALSQEVARAAIPSIFRMATIKAALAYGRGAEAASPVVAGLIKQVSGGMKMSLLKALTAILLAAGAITGGTSAMVYLGAQPDDDKNAPTSDGGTDLKSVLHGRVTGKVINAADGLPVSGADVRIARRGQYSGTVPWRHATTDSQGRFHFDSLSPGEYRVLSFHGNLASRTKMFQGDTVSVAKNGESKPVTLKLQPGVEVRVKVLCQATGQPLKGARVRLIWTDMDRDHYADDKGEVLLQALTPETYHIQATAEHCAAEVQIVNLANEQPTSLEFKLPPGGAVQGQFTDSNGRPIVGVGVNIFDTPERGPLDYVETDAKGQYRVDFLPVDRNLLLYSHKLSFLADNSYFRIDNNKEALKRLDIVLKNRPHGGSVSGVVTDSQGKPVADAAIHNQGSSSNEARKTKTDAQGKFLLDDVYSDGIGHQLVVKARGFAPERVEFKPGTAASPAAVEVQLKPGHRIKGRVVNSKGRPIPGVNVYYAHGNSHPGMEFGGSATTDDQGRFQFDSLPPDAPFAFNADGYSEIAEMKLPLDGDQVIDVQMKAQGFIKGCVVDAVTSKPIPRFNVRITFSEDRKPDDPVVGLSSRRISPGEDFVSAQGRFRLGDLLDGMPLQVTVLAPGYRRQVQRRVVAQPEDEGEETLIKMTPEDPAKLTTIRGKVLNHKGQAVSGAELRLIVATDRPAQRDAFPFNWQMIETGQIEQAPNVLQVRQATTPADGGFVFQRVPSDAEIELFYWGKGIPSGRVDHIEAQAPKKPQPEARARDSKSQPRPSSESVIELQVKCPAPSRVTGTIDRKVFPEIGSIQLSVSGGPGAGSFRYFDAKKSADGKSFDIDDLPEGQYDLQINSTPKRVPDHPGAFQQTVIGRRMVNLKAGKVEKIDMGKDDLVPAP